ncbi:SCO family protein [Telmatobacter bradus]|uniref:SCO family protein n=1 Tax=Telmatobacter bradus TaxID=474953 RepID=UPI003B435F9F
MRLRRNVIGCVLAVLALVLAGCKPKQEAPAPVHVLNGVARYALHGVVLGVSAEAGELTVRHDEIHGVMPAMTMNYKVKDAAVLKGLQAGDEINAQLLVPEGNADYALEAITVLRHAAVAKDTLPAHTLLPGEPVPDISMVNQDGQKIHLRGLAGKAVLLTFVYTRCPMPTACPMISSHMAQVHKLLAADAKAYAGSRLISVTLDPAYDAPEVLRRYGLAYLADDPAGFAHWEFARTTPQDLQTLAGAFGLAYRAENNQITHSMRTVLLGADGKVVQVWEGSAWKPEDVAEAVKQATSKAKR